MDLLNYKGYHGSVECAFDQDVLHGKVLFINDLVTYEATTPSELKAEFEAAVDDYIETCAAIGKPAEKAFSGQFNVRVKPELHQQASVRAAKEKKSLNAVVAEALEQHLADKTVFHEHRHTLELDLNQAQTLTATTGAFTMPRFTSLESTTHRRH